MSHDSNGLGWSGGETAVIEATDAGVVPRTRRVERLAYAVAGLLLVSGVFHLGVLLVTGSSWVGPLSWRKPATFGISFGLALAALTWALSLVEVRAPTRTRILLALVTACVLEVTVITVQRWRGEPSHFGVSGPGAPVVAGAAVAGFALLVAAVVALGVQVLRWPGFDRPLLLALRVGFGWLLVSFALGGYMLARGQVISRLHGDVAGAFAFSATLKPAHEITFAGILLLPALARLLTTGRRTGTSDLRPMAVVCLGYSLLCLAAVVDGLLRSTF